MLAVYSDKSGEAIALKVIKATSFLVRLKGLALKPRLEPEDGLWLCPCRAIHTWGLGFSIDAIFLDRDLVIVAIERRLKPFCSLKYHLKAFSVLELGAGQSDLFALASGDRLSIRT